MDWVTLAIAVIALFLSLRRELFLVPRVTYLVTELSEYPGTGHGLSLAVHRLGVAGPVPLKWGCKVRILSEGGSAASNVQIRATAPAGASIVQIHTDDTKLVERLPEIWSTRHTRGFCHHPLDGSPRRGQPNLLVWNTELRRKTKAALDTCAPRRRSGQATRLTEHTSARAFVVLQRGAVACIAGRYSDQVERTGRGATHCPS